MYFKGIKMNPEMEGFHHGVDKCKETISNIVRKSSIQFIDIIVLLKFYYSRNQDIFTFQGIQSFLDYYYLRENEQKKKNSRFAKHESAPKKVLVAEKKICPMGRKRRADRRISDKMFLSNLAQQINDMDIAGPWGQSVTNKAIEGMEFLRKRDDFWNQIDTL